MKAKRIWLAAGMLCFAAIALVALGGATAMRAAANALATPAAPAIAPGSVAVALPLPQLPPDLSRALALEYGRFESIVQSVEFLETLAAAGVVGIGEAHYEAQDMQTAFELVRLLSRRRQVALAVERLPHDLQAPLDALNQLSDPGAREAALQQLLQNTDYQTVWGARPRGRSGYPINSPSRVVFEAMVRWSARARIPILALDVTLAERQGGSDGLAYRNGVWARRIRDYRQARASSAELIIVVAGVDHMRAAPDALPARLRTELPGVPVVSLGQRDAMYQYNSPRAVAQLATAHGLSDLIVRRPQYAVVSVKQVPAFPDPPDYWIAYHPPDTWDP